MPESGHAAVAHQTTAAEGEPTAAAAQKPPQAILEQPPYRAFYSLPVEIVVCVGTARPPLGELLAVGPEAVIVLDRRIDEPVDIRVGDRVVARGELQELDDGSGRLGVRLTEIMARGGSF